MRFAPLARQAKDLALVEAKTKEHRRGLEAARLLKAAHEEEHVGLAQEASDRAELLHREEILLPTRPEIEIRAAKLDEARQAAKDSMAAQAAQALATATAKKIAAKAERIAPALAASRGEPYLPRMPPPHTHT